MAPGATAGANAALAAAMQALRSFGPIARIEPEDFRLKLHQAKDVALIVSKKGVLKKKMQYLMPWKGVYLYCESVEPLEIPGNVEPIYAKSLMVPTAG